MATSRRTTSRYGLSEVLRPGGRKPCSTAPRHRGVAVGSVVEVALPPRSRDGGSPPGPLARLTVTWLILPVVICLSQRLSHACLCVNASYCETANGSLNHI